MEAVEQYGRPTWVIGSPIEHTLSPLIHNAAFRAAELPHRYFALEVTAKELPEFLESFRNIDGLGANLTLPLKETVRNHIDNETEAVQATEAANTLFRESGTLKLDNTDVYGFKKLVDRWEKRIRKEPVLLLGAGGAARACLQGLRELECERVILWNRTTSKAENLKDSFSSVDIEIISDEDLEEFDGAASLVINATSLGLESNDPSPYPVDRISGDMIGVDLIYGQETAFLSDFRSRGSGAIDGLEMLIEQAARAWERWVGESPDIDVMKQAVSSHHSN